MKKLSYLFILLAVATFSCKDKEDEVSPLEEARLSFADEEQVVEAPEGLVAAAADNNYAAEAYSYIQMANNMSNYFAIFYVPDGAEKTTTPISSSNARTAAVQQEYLVYKWENHQGFGVAYQVHDAGDKFVFEGFYKDGAEADYKRYIYAEELKNARTGKMEVFDWEGGGDLVWSYSWQTDGDNFYFEMGNPEQSFVVDMQFNNSTGAGSVTYTLNGSLLKEMSWDGDGSGEWTYYNTEGAVTNSGTWQAS